MLEEKRKAANEVEDGEVVYSRLETRVPDEGAGQPVPPSGKPRGAPEERYVSPALTPLLIGFALLLALVIGLGYLSVRQLDDVSSQVLDFETQYAGRLSLLLKLRVAATKLNTEARARSQAKARKEIAPPLALPLRNARNELTELLPLLDRPPFNEQQTWRELRQELTEFVQATETIETYEAIGETSGFRKFQKADQRLNDMLNEAGREQEDILHRAESLQERATRKILLLTAIALLSGLLVALATAREVQRRFREMRESLDLAGREQRQFSTQMLEGMVSAIAAIDEHDRIRSANSAFYTIFPGATVGASVHSEFASSEAMKMLEAATASRVREATYRGRWVCGPETPECANRTFDIYSSPLTIDGAIGQLITLVDVTEAAGAESVLRRTEALAAVGQAAAQVAHEIKNPLGSIRLGVSMLRDMTTDDEALNTIDLVERGIDHLNKLAVDVTQFSRRKELKRSNVVLQDILEESLSLVSDRIKAKDTRVEKIYGEDTLRGHWDADQLRQVFVNLLANAVDASPENAPIIIQVERGTGEAARAQTNGDRKQPGQIAVARVRIEDRGGGIDEKMRTRIFEPFFTTKKRGTGLGLAIVKQIVEQHGGTITVASHQGEGAIFTIELPLML